MKNNNSKLPPKADQPRAEKFAIVLSIIFSGVLFFAKDSFAAPSISGTPGTFSQGSSVIITGSSFGTKSPAAPVRFENFEQSNSLRVGGTAWNDWASTRFFGDQDLSTDTCYSGSHCVKSHEANTWNSANEAVGFGLDFTTTMGSRLYSYQKIKYNWHTSGINNKIFRYWPNANDTYPNFYMEQTNGGIITFEGGGGPSMYPPDPDMPDHPIGSWVNEEFLVQLSSNTSARDGYFWYWRNNTALVSPSNCGYFTFAGAPGRYYFQATHYNGSPPAPAYVWFDNLYWDKTWARVMLGNATTYANSSNREIQIPQAWSDNSITFKANTGSFSSGQTAYLYVFDASGNVNASGYPVTIGSGSQPDTTPPAAPSGVTVQ